MRKIFFITVVLLAVINGVFICYSYGDESDFYKNEELYLSNTGKILFEGTKLIQKLNVCADKMEAEGEFDKEEITYLDNEILNFENLLKEIDGKYIEHTGETSGGEYSTVYLANGESYYINDYWYAYRYYPHGTISGAYLAARKRYCVNSMIYLNNWIDMSKYIIDNFADTKRNTLNIDGLVITKKNLDFNSEDILYDIDLENAKSYEILEPSEESYGYPVIKIVTQNENTYVVTGFFEDREYKQNKNDYKIWRESTEETGQISGGVNGSILKIRDKNAERYHIFSFNTSKIDNSLKNEYYSINDILKKYLNEHSEENLWKYKDLIILKNKKNDYTITIKNLNFMSGDEFKNNIFIETKNKVKYTYYNYYNDKVKNNNELVLKYYPNNSYNNNSIKITLKID